MSLIIPIATLHEHPQGRRYAVTLRQTGAGIMAWSDDIGTLMPLLDASGYATWSDAADALFQRHDTKLHWSDAGTAYATERDAGSKNDPVAHSCAWWAGMMMLDLPQLRVLTLVGPAAERGARAAADWLALALPDQPVRFRPAAPDTAEVVVGCIHE